MQETIQEGGNNKDSDPFIEKLNRVSENIKEIESCIIKVEIDLINNKYSSMVTQEEIESDSLDKILEARVEKIKKQDSRTTALHSEIMTLLGVIRDKNQCIKNYEIKIKNVEFCKPSSSFYIKTMLRKAHRNKDQAKGSKSMFGSQEQYYNSYPYEKEFVNTLPKKLVGILNQWLNKHTIILPSVLPSQSNIRNNSFDINNRHGIASAVNL